MEKADTAARGKVILATVKGDVHDIGKNLVEIILANNGYQVINLGIKVPPEALIQACHEHQPDAIGLSGLLVKSTQQMVITAGDLQGRRHHACRCWWAARRCRRSSPARKIAPAYGDAVCYAKDAMTGLQPDEPPHGPGRARGACWPSHTLRRSAAPPRRRRPKRRAPPATDAQRQGAHRHPHSRRRRTWTARSATCRTWPKCGATSIRSCSTAGIWATRAISKRRWRSANPRRWSCSTTWKQ